MDKSYGTTQQDDRPKKIRFNVKPKVGSPIVETLWAYEVGKNRYSVANIPALVHSVSWHDIVCALPVPNGGQELVFQEVLEKSGNRTVRAHFYPPVASGNQSHAVLQKILARGCTSEGGIGGLVSINVPPSVVLDEVLEYLTAEGVGWEPGDPSLEELGADGQSHPALDNAAIKAPATALPPDGISHVCAAPPRQQDETLTGYVELPGEEFHDFFSRMSAKVSEERLDTILPVRAKAVPPGTEPLLYRDYWLNWSDFAAGFCSAVMWLQRLYGELPEAEVQARFTNLTEDEKGYVQRGYQILHEGQFPPFTNGFVYEVDVEAYDLHPGRALDFPCIASNEPEDEYLEGDE